MKLALLVAVSLAAAAAQTFDAASIKPSQAQPGSSSGITTKIGSIQADNVTLKRCIRGAYDVSETTIFGGEKWVGEERYDIVAKAGSPAGDQELMMMLRALLADRFKLAIHRETRQITGYRLVAAKSGIKAKPSLPGTERSATSRNGGVEAKGCDMNCLAGKMSEALHAPVTNGTGIQGAYDFTLSWPTGDMDAAVFSAIQEQLGLKLESRKVPAEVIVIDRAERPAAN